MSGMRVYNTDVLDSLLESGAAAEQNATAEAAAAHDRSASRHSAAEDATAVNMAERERQRRDLREKQFRSRMERLHKDVERRILQQTEKRELKFQTMLQNYEKERDEFEHVRDFKVRTVPGYTLTLLFPTRLGNVQNGGLQGAGGPAALPDNVSGVVRKRFRQNTDPCLREG